MIRSSAASALYSNIGLTRPPSFSLTGAADERITFQYAGCNQPIQTSNAQPKGHNLHATRHRILWIY